MDADCRRLGAGIASFNELWTEDRAHLIENLGHGTLANMEEVYKHHS